MTMDWNPLLSEERLGAEGRPASPPEEGQTEGERDYGRVLYSTPFRRLHSKTQVFPMPENDHVHSRLTHSLEVAYTGMYIGNRVGREVIARHGKALAGRDSRQFGFIVSAACLAHDIGNPPFGHSGERAIASVFRGESMKPLLERLTPWQQADLKSFEGNAQGFRILARKSQQVDRGGMRLSMATLGAYTKYPQRSLDVPPKTERRSRKKFGYFQSETEEFRRVAVALGLAPHEAPPGENEPTGWRRHPLAFLTEAADDICYCLLDLEDGCTLNLVDGPTFVALTKPIAQTRDDPKDAAPDREHIGLLRAFAIKRLANEVVCAFLDHEADILSGAFDTALTDVIPSAAGLRAIQDYTREQCYRDPDVIKREVAGRRVISTLLTNFLTALDRDDRHILRLIPDGVPQDIPLFDRIQRITDYVSGMTDRYAVTLFRQLEGVSIFTL